MADYNSSYTGAQIDAAVGAVASKADDTAVVHDTGNETIGGVKTFSSFPVTPSTVPTDNYQAANKKYIDDKVKTDVPVGAKFTDTIYTHPDTHSADIIVDGETNKAYTSTEKTKLSGIAIGAQVNVQSDWNQTTDTADDYIKNKPTIPAGGAPGLTFGTSNSAGVAESYIKTDATIAAFDSTAPSTQSFGDSASTGSATKAARRDHKHAMPASPKDTTAVTGILKGNGTAISAAARGTDYSLGFAGTGTIASSASWSGPDAQGYYTYAVTATGVLITDNVDITCVKSVSDSAAAALIQTAWNLVENVVIAASTLTFYAKTRPSVAVPIAWKVVR